MFYLMCMGVLQKCTCMPGDSVPGTGVTNSYEPPYECLHHMSPLEECLIAQIPLQPHFACLCVCIPHAYLVFRETRRGC